MNIILIAPPAAGKGTQAELLRINYNIEHISTGDLLREAVANGSELGEYISKIQKEGKIVDDNIVLQLLEERLKSVKTNGYILDGFPRTLEQAIKYEDILNRLEQKLDYVFFLDITKEEAEKRVLGRVTCPNCKKIYNEYFDKFDNIGFCNLCKVKLDKRNDDNKDTFDIRFNAYIENTKPVVDYYKNKGMLYIINGNLDKENTFKQIEDIINKVII